MIFNEELMFIHIGKTGGTSCADYLLRTLHRPVYNCHAGAARQNRRLGDPGLVAVTGVNRHCTARDGGDCMQLLTGRSITDLRRVLAVIRNPCTLEYSFYRHLQTSVARSHHTDATAAARKLAQGDFKTFVKEAGYHGPGLRQEEFFLIKGRAPDNLMLLRFENLEAEFLAAVEPFVDTRAAGAFPHRLQTDYDTALDSLLDDETRALIYEKHRYMFDHYYPGAV